MPSPSWPGIRPGATRVSVYNEALLVYLFDESHLPMLQTSEADFESGYADADAEIDPPLKKLAKDRILVAYELFQDNEIDLEVVVGPPLSKSELKSGPWMKPVNANLRLPGGVLRIDTANTLPIEEASAEEPARVKVPPGDYVLSLYRLNRDKFESQEEAWDGPQEILVLTPAAKAKPVKGTKALLRYSRPPEKWIGQYTIADAVFRGKAFANDAKLLFLLNMDRTATQRLDLTRGSMLQIELENFKTDVVYIGEIEMPGQHKVRLPRGDRKEFGLAYRTTSTFDDDREHKVVIERVVKTNPFPTLGKWIPATARVLEMRMEGI